MDECTDPPARLSIPAPLAAQLDPTSYSLLADLVARRDLDFVHTPTVGDLSARTQHEESMVLAALARLVELGVVRIGVELVPDVLYGYRFGEPLRRRRRNRTSARHRIRELIRRRDGNRCRNPLCPATNCATGIDHFIASSRGGGQRQSNLGVLCRRCDSHKGAQLPSDFITMELLTAIAPESQMREEDLRALRARVRTWLEHGFANEPGGAT